MTAQFTIENSSDQGVKDIEVTCKYMVSNRGHWNTIGGTVITIKQTLPAKQTQTFTDLNVGVQPGGTERTQCYVSNLVPT